MEHWRKFINCTMVQQMLEETGVDWRNTSATHISLCCHVPRYLTIGWPGNFEECCMADENRAASGIEDRSRISEAYFEPFGSDWIEEPLQPAEREAVRELAERKELQRSVLYGMAYLASVMLSDDAGYQPEKIEEIAAAYHANCASRMGCVDIAPEQFRVYAMLLFGDPSFRLPDKKIRAFFALYAILNGCSVWQGKGMSVGEALLKLELRSVSAQFSELLTGLMPPEKIDAALESLLEACAASHEGIEDIDDLLDTVLLRYQHLHSDHLQKICDILYRDTIITTQTERMDRLLDGPNGTAFRDYIMNGFVSGCEKGIAQYHFCAASICNTERTSSGENALEAAVAGMTKAETEAEFLLNTMCLGMIAWNPAGKLRTLQKQIERLKLDQGLTDKLCAMLRVPDKLCYPIVACTVHDLLISGVLGQEIFDRQMRDAAIRALTDADIRKRAEELLTQIPVGISCEVRETENPITAEYHERLGKSLSDFRWGTAPEIPFAVLCHLNAWLSVQHRWEMLERVCHYYMDNGKNLYLHNRTHLNGLLEQLMPGKHPWPLHNTDVSPETLGAPLTKEEHRSIRTLSKDLAAPWVKEYVITDADAALALVKYLKLYAGGVARIQNPETENLVRKIRLNVPGAGSCLIVNWFRFLCIYNCTDLAVEFYREHRDILDLPDSIQILHMLKRFRAPFEIYKRFVQSEKRVEAGVLYFVHHGRMELLEAFMKSEFRDVVDNQAFADRLLHQCRGKQLKEIARIYEGRYGTQAAWEKTSGKSSLSEELAELLQRLLEDRGMDENGPAKSKAADAAVNDEYSLFTKMWSLDEVGEYWPTYYYDDLTVLKYCMLHSGSWGSEVLNLGYSDDREMVALAVAKNGKSLDSASPRLQADYEICLTALRNSGYALPYVRSELLDDFRLVKEILLAGEYTLCDMPEPYCSDFDVVLAAVQRDGNELLYATREMRANREIAKAALQHKRKFMDETLSIEWVDETLTDDKELMLLAVKVNPAAYPYLSPRLRDDPDILACLHDEAGYTQEDLDSMLEW